MRFRIPPLPMWAFVTVGVTPPVLMLALLWFLCEQTLRTAATVELVAKAYETGLMEQAGNKAIAAQAIGSGYAFAVLAGCIFAVAILQSVMFLATARRQKESES